MELRLSPEREAQLNDYAARHGQDAESALDEALAAALEWEREDYREAVQGIERGFADLQNGRVRPLAESLENLRVKHGFQR